MLLYRVVFFVITIPKNEDVVFVQIQDVNVYGV